MRSSASTTVAPTLPLLALAFIAGTVSAAALGGSSVAVAATVGLLLLGLRVRGPVPLLACIAAVAIGAAGHARFEAAASRPPPSIANAVDGQHDIEGVVRRDATVAGVLGRLDVEVERVDGAPVEGGVRVSLPVGDGLPREGDRVRLTGTVEAPPVLEDFDYAAYLRTLRIHAVVAYPSTIEVVEADTGSAATRALRGFRRAALINIERSLAEPEAALAAGVLIGARGSLPSQLRDDLRTTGTTHLVVVSGQNVAVLLGVAVALLTVSFSRPTASLLALLLLPTYVVLTGADPPVVRGALMGAGIAIAGVAGRRTPAWIYLAYAVALMLAFDPLLALDLAFQLSAVATAGVVLLAPVLRTVAVSALRLRDTSPLIALIDVIATTTSASLAVLPLQASTFGYVSLVAVPANAAVGLLYEGTFFVAALSVALGWFAPAATAIEAGGSLVPAAFVATVSAFADLPSAVVPASMSPASAAAWYALLCLTTFTLARLRLPPESSDVSRRGASRLAPTAALGVVASGVWFAALTPADDLARVVVLDVGQGLAVLVEDGDSSVLVDAGPPDGAVLAALGEAGVRGGIDALVLTHDDIDHTGGASELVMRYEVGAVLSAADGPSSVAIDIGDQLRLSERSAIEVLSPPVMTASRAHESDNDRSLVLLLTIGDRRILLTADIEASAEEWLVRSGLDLRADILLVPHHGSNTSSTPALIEAVQPALAIVSSGLNNPHGHPHPAVLGRFATEGIPVVRTDERGNIEMRSDGEALWLETEP